MKKDNTASAISEFFFSFSRKVEAYWTSVLPHPSSVCDGGIMNIDGGRDTNVKPEHTFDTTLRAPYYNSQYP